MSRTLALVLVLLSASALATEEDAGTPGAIEDFEPAPPPLEEVASTPVAGPTVQVSGSLRLQAGVDTGFEPQRSDGLSERVVDGRGRAALATDVKLSPSLRLLVEGRALWRANAEDGLERAKAFFEPTLGEAFLDLYTPRVDFRVGQQTLAFGANAAFAPTDVLNPRDLRESLALTEPEDTKLPVFAARALGSVGPLSLTVAWVPFFTPHRYNVFGQDEALVQPGLGQGLPLSVDSSIEDALQPRLLETERPQAFPYLGDVGLRVTSDLGGVRVGGSWVWGNEKLPQVELDPELEALLRAQERGETPDTALLLSVQERLRSGETLVTGRYARQHVFGVEATALLETVQLDLDVGFSPAQTFTDERLRPLRKPSVTWVLGVSQAEDSDLVYSVTYLGLAVPRVAAGELLVLLEPGTARGQPRTTFFHLLVADATYTLSGGDWELGLRGTFEPVQRSFTLAPRVNWRVTERLSVGLAAEVYAGKPYSPLGYFGRNDQLLGSVRLTL
ncbi:hypothetical protein [Hyalangium rubrum]|uniref:Uncharacterized protein n=1 Tax=Hyalangium rubrum TaxID=3103134 RepID=A0ABU5H7F3_9BACT|nr:hypothetical protein [Hyalangium sp. s54d21]MDY7228687.1 hypothetical protein [Hyalangium sp. s54d21]